ncbi:alanine racemase [Fulvivirga sediminis]|uniref:Alanine racemase n=1 Tax=Fulvivirga sediminis TaxID=2803949 RepID=A0A937FCD9_9BACT|nr:alanine racemase [Fulvivirga sediminis]MBL3658320.1 alanine racemase [Fulvivirga sediminis]
MQTETSLLPPLTPKVHSWISQFISDPERVRSVIKQYGSPVNLHSTTPFIENYENYKRVLDKYELNHLICFARKANKSKSFVKAASEHGFGVDTASYRELLQCLDEGMDKDKLILTAAIKNKELIELAIKNEVLIIIDNLDELELTKKLSTELGVVAQIGLRLGGFHINGHKLYTRFGVDIEEAKNFMLDHIQQANQIQFRGFHFHLNGYSIDERAKAIAETIALIDEMRKYEISTEFIDIGGGLLINYLEDREEWDEFQEELKMAVQGFREPITFQNNGLGYSINDGELIGNLATYPYYNETHKEDFLEAILSYPTGKGEIATLLKDRNITIRMEPGRSLLDQSGVTLAEVVFRKYDSQGNLLIGLHMNKTQLFSSSADFLLDPIVLNYESNEDSEPTSGYFVGAYCLEQDVILKRKINLAKTPAIGDIVCFPNTAGYMMHFYETEAHLFNLSTNLFLKENGKVERD